MQSNREKAWGHGPRGYADDLTTGDAITPGAIEYPFPMMFDEGSLRVMSYPIATCVAEKYEALVKRGALTTRARDLYDIFRFVELYGDSLDWDSVSLAIDKTAEHRGSLELMGDFSRVCDEMLATTAYFYFGPRFPPQSPFVAYSAATKK